MLREEYTEKGDTIVKFQSGIFSKIYVMKFVNSIKIPVFKQNHIFTFKNYLSYSFSDLIITINYFCLIDRIVCNLKLCIIRKMLK